MDRLPIALSIAVRGAIPDSVPVTAGRAEGSLLAAGTLTLWFLLRSAAHSTSPTPKLNLLHELRKNLCL